MTNQPTCVCPDCTGVPDSPVCALVGDRVRTFTSECEMRLEACSHTKNYDLLADRACEGEFAHTQVHRMCGYTHIQNTHTNRTLTHIHTNSHSYTGTQAHTLDKIGETRASRNICVYSGFYSQAGKNRNIQSFINFCNLRCKRRN